jgi:hypothetical protein
VPRVSMKVEHCLLRRDMQRSEIVGLKVLANAAIVSAWPVPPFSQD